MEAGLFRFAVARRVWTTDENSAGVTRLSFLLNIRVGSGAGDGDTGVWPDELPDGVRYVPYSSWAQSSAVHEIQLPSQPSTYTAADLPTLEWEGLRDVYFPNLQYYLDAVYIDGEYVPIDRVRSGWMIIYDRGFRNYGGLGSHTLTLNFLNDGGETLTYNLKYTIREASAPEPNGFRHAISGTLPQGRSLDFETGEIKGVPMVSGTWSFRVTITDLAGVEETRDCSLTIWDNSYVDMADNDYEITKSVGDEDPQNPNYFLKDSYTEETLVINGPYDEFTRLLIDGRPQERGGDYTAREGSTVITIRAQTFERMGEGTHTIAAEFRTGGTSQGELKKAAQNYTLTLPSSSPSFSGGNFFYGGSSKKNTNKTQGSQQTSVLPFADVSPSDWFYQDLVWAYENGLMFGVSETAFMPQEKVTQATVVTALARVDLTQFEGAEEPGIISGRSFTPSAVWAKRSGLLPEESAFTGGETTNRNEMAVMLVKYLARMGKDTTPPSQCEEFADAAEMTREGNEAFQVLYQHGIFGGVGGMRMNPVGSTTRAHFVTLIHRIYNTAIAEM